jgi:hypothetical protein
MGAGCNRRHPRVVAAAWDGVDEISTSGLTQLETNGAIVKPSYRA